MISGRAGQSRPQRLILRCGGSCACALWSAATWAQSSALSPAWPTPSPNIASDRPNTASGDRSDKRSDHLRVGALIGVGFPRPLAVEGIIKLERVLALRLEYSAQPQINVSDVSFTSWAVAGGARFFPLRGPFFVGLRAGRQHVNAEASVSGYGYTVPITLGVDTTFVNPQLGFLWTWDPGFTIGINAGVQIPLSSSSSSSLSSGTVPSAAQPFVSPVQRTVENVAVAVGQTVLPTVDLLRIGVLF